MHKRVHKATDGFRDSSTGSEVLRTGKPLLRWTFLLRATYTTQFRLTKRCSLHMYSYTRPLGPVPSPAFGGRRGVFEHRLVVAVVLDRSEWSAKRSRSEREAYHERRQSSRTVVPYSGNSLVYAPIMVESYFPPAYGLHRFLIKYHIFGFSSTF